jgi:hypothetical protein
MNISPPRVFNGYFIFYNFWITLLLLVWCFFYSNFTHESGERERWRGFSEKRFTLSAARCIIVLFMGKFLFLLVRCYIW